MGRKIHHTFSSDAHSLCLFGITGGGVEESLCSRIFSGGVLEQFGQTSYLVPLPPNGLVCWAHFHTLADLA